ncbi:MAG: 3-dehydroquinate dehydratase [Actinomycetes bacterium]|jgi:3-dehydroquinate dehydratase-2|nr:3-dehydroquinate dehydratase [Actinomycetes bacterium]
MNILVLNGPNLNLLGLRAPDVYGSTTIDQLCDRLEHYAAARDIALTCVQSNHEGAIIDALHDAIGRYDGVVLNPGALGHYSWALRDAVDALRDAGLPTVEVHLSEPRERPEAFRHVDVLDGVVAARFAGLGGAGYERALDVLGAGRTPPVKTPIDADIPGD